MWGLVVHNLVKNCNYMEWYSNDSVQTTCKGYNIPVIYVGFTDFDSKFVDIYDDAYNILKEFKDSLTKDYMFIWFMWPILLSSDASISWSHSLLSRAPCRNFSNFFLKTTRSVISVHILVLASMRKYILNHK